MNEESLMTAFTGLTPQQQIYCMVGMYAFGFLGKVISAARMGNGLRGMLLTLWYGTNIPKTIAEDYKKELQTK